MAPTAIIVRDPERARAAHLLRRTALGVHLERVEELAGRSPDDAISAVLDHDREPPAIPTTEEWTDVTAWWLERMTEPDTGLTDRMTWFWHGLLTTNAYKVSSAALVGDQLADLRANARTDFRALLHGFVSSGALLEYLDASWSIASNPNENLGRELMELFTIGRGRYTEDDVRAAARALAGWVVDEDRVAFHRENAFVAPLIFLGEQAEWDTASVVDRLCDHPATAVRISHRLWRDLVGTDLPNESATELGAWWQANDLAIDPLIERILRDPSFDEQRFTRARSGVEWYSATAAAIGLGRVDAWQLENLGQMPYLPPSVAGWPGGDRWLTPGSVLSRAAFVHDVDLADGTEVARYSSTPAVLDRCCLFEVSEATEAAMSAVADTPDLSTEGAQLARWRLALTSPEFNLR